ncbi:2'-5' RNA ligase family protein [Nafulsella turpanensis]|uniref:2'-5' RNA ligase family protein n=1 Tax=Nafulsella turpanensis TaxID=1265690 RepID=UPI000348F1E3|nr:2'-5' RNA ligase family protein [Nafulsella turpanensis]
MAQKMLYFIALVPPEPFKQQAYALKEHFRDHYGSKASLNSPAHITLYPPFKLAAEEKELIDSLQELGQSVAPFEVRLNGFGAFPPRVIFIDVDPSAAMHHLQQGLLRLVPPFAEKEKNSHAQAEKTFHPHMTVAFRDLSKSMFKEAWTKYKEEALRYQWQAKDFTLLRHNGRYWGELQQIPLGFSAST